MITQALMTKVITALGPIVVAWYVSPEQLGVLSIAFMFSILPLMIQQGGLREVLIARHAHFHRWANPAFWMSMGLGVVGGAVMFAIAPIAAHLYHEPSLFGLLVVIAILFPLESISVVPLAHIQGQMRFRLVAAIEMGKAVLITGLTILMAWRGFGAYSLIVPRVFVSVLAAIVCWSMAPVPLRWNLQIRRWRFLVSDGALVIAASACEYVMQYIGPFFLSIFEDTRVVGLFWFASYHSTQATTLITYQLGNVLFPALSKLQLEPQRQTDAFLRAVRLLACMAMPACLLQAALINPAVHLIFPTKWWDAIILLQVLSVGMAMRAAGWPAVAMLQAQRRFRTRLILTVTSTVLLAALVAAGILIDRTNPARGAAIGVALQFLIMEPIALRIAIAPTGQGWAAVRHALAAPIAIALGSVAPAALVAMTIGPIPGQNIWRCAVIIVVSAGLFFPLFWRLAPQAWEEARTRVLALLARPRTA